MGYPTWHARKEALLIWAHHAKHRVPATFNARAPECGWACEELVRAFQTAEGLTPDGVWGPHTEAAMVRFLHPPAPKPPTDPRERYLSEWWWALATDIRYKETHGGATAFPYLALRPYSLALFWERHAVPMAPYDCSSSSIVAAKRAGRNDPSGQAYDGYGNTQSMLDHLPHLASIADCQPGDLIVFAGDPERQHVVTCTGNGAGTGDPWIFSHGSPGIGHWPLSWEIPAHRGQPIVPLSFAP